METDFKKRTLLTLGAITIFQDYMFDGINGKEYTNEKYDTGLFKRNISDIEKVIIHCTATDSERWENPMALIGYDLNPNHISKNGCPYATYHFYINKLGNIYQLVSMNYKCWHCTDQNKYSVAICINHGGKIENVTEAQYHGLKCAIFYVFNFMEWEMTERSLRYRLYFHRFFANKFCPGFLDYETLIKDLKID